MGRYENSTRNRSAHRVAAKYMTADGKWYMIEEYIMDPRTSTVSAKRANACRQVGSCRRRHVIPGAFGMLGFVTLSTEPVVASS